MATELILETTELKKTSRLEQFLNELNQSGIQYCQWKSTDSIPNALAGNDDFDLLVSEQDLGSMHEMLKSYAFVPASPASALSLPGVEHYYGYDEIQNNFIHLHLYSKLLTGESLVQTHHFPVENWILENCEETENVKTCSPDAELAIFLLRMMIKNGSRLERAWFGDRQPKVKQKLNRLLKNSEPGQAYDWLISTGIQLEKKVFIKAVQTLKNDAPIQTRIKLGRRFWEVLKPYERFNQAGRLSQYLKLTKWKLRSKLSREKAKKILKPTGTVIALAGGDASGKSTILNDLESWLNPVFITKRFHVGKPTPGFFTWPVHSLLPLARRLFPHLRRNGVARQDSSSARKSTSLLQAVRAIALAWDRRRLVSRIHKLKQKGELVLCDRYPSTALGAMDSPRIQVTGKTTTKQKLIHLLAQWEQSIYEKIPAPDVVVKLTVPIEIAQQRNALRNKSDKHPADELTARHQSFNRWNRQGTELTTEIDTSGDQQETIDEVRHLIWTALSSLGTGGNHG